MHKVLAEKMKESAMAVLPIGAIILILHCFVVPLPGMTLPMMLTGMFMLFLGMSLFSIGVDMAMMPIGPGPTMTTSSPTRTWARSCSRWWVATMGSARQA